MSTFSWPSAIMGRMARAPARSWTLGVLLAGVLLAGMLLAGCTSDGSSPPTPSGSPAGEVALSVTSVRTPGVDEDTRTRLEAEIGDVVATYVVGGFLGDYPRTDFARSLTGFSVGLAEEGGRDLDVLTLSELAAAAKVSSVRATRLDVQLAYFTPGGEAQGATAFLDLGFEVTLEDGTTLEVARTGKLVLTKRGEWHVVGYRLCCGDDALLDAGTTT